MKNLSHLAFKSQNTFGRALPASLDCDCSLYFMDPYALDLVKILNSKALRRLRGKTQVISGSGNCYIRDRLTHSFEVSAGALQSGYRLGLNTNLLQASGLGHDLGHVPMGHLGEAFIADKLKEPFRHELFAIFVLEIVERNWLGLNLSYETLDAIRNHPRGSGLMTTTNGPLENDVVMYEDKFFYIAHDLNDIKRFGYDFVMPDEILKLGQDQTEILTSCHRALWSESIRKGKISFDDSEEARCFKTVRNFMYQEVYRQIDISPERDLLREILKKVFYYFECYFDNTRQAALALALMSEQDAYALYDLLSVYSFGAIEEKLLDTRDFSIAELLPRIPELAEFDFCNPSRFMDKKNFGKISKEECFAL